MDLEFDVLIRNLLRRTSLVHYFHGNGRWNSSRQEQRINMGGFVGEITFEGDLRSFMPLIKAGEVLHVGKGTAFGLGRHETRGPT
jgi:hypothetical protein